MKIGLFTKKSKHLHTNLPTLQFKICMQKTICDLLLKNKTKTNFHYE